MFEKIVTKLKKIKEDADNINKRAEENVKKKYPQGTGSTNDYASKVAKEIHSIRKARKSTKIFETKAPMEKKEKSVKLNTLKTMPLKNKGQERLKDIVRGVSYKKNY